MPKNICVNQRAVKENCGVPTGFMIAVVVSVLALLGVTSQSPHSAVEPTATIGVTLEDWHGNVMRSR